jgi:hypothetical protein
MLYLLLRDFQALRFMHELSSGILGTKFDGILDEIYTALVRAWNGKTELSGWSMGGYQTICVSALAAKAGIPLIFVRSVIPGFCNLSGHKIDGRFNNSFGIQYDKAMTYYDRLVQHKDFSIDDALFAGHTFWALGAKDVARDYYRKAQNIIGGEVKFAEKMIVHAPHLQRLGLSDEDIIFLINQIIL